MSTFSIPSNDFYEKGLLLNHIELEGPHQMALDQLFLNQSIEKSNYLLAIRFYSWKGYWLSIGKNQNHIPKEWKDLMYQKKINIVRRPSGGKAVLHGGGLTYALIWKSPPIKKRQAYIQASEWIQKGFDKLGIYLKFGKEKATSLSKNCFASATSADLLDSNGEKRVGSAQRWKKGSLLQHGEIILNPPKEIWVDLFDNNPPSRINLNLTNKELEQLLIKEILSCWNKLNWSQRDLNENEIIQSKFDSKDYLI